MGRIALRLVASLAGVAIVTFAAYTLIPINATSVAFKQLFDNALKYSPSGTSVTIRLFEVDGMITVEVTDHGSVIPVQEQSHIFERFYRSPSVRQQIPGSGLGLSIANTIMQAHHGGLNVRSSPGDTTFRMTLPTERKGERT